MISIFKKIKINNLRTKNIAKHILLSFLFKGGSVALNFLLIPLIMANLTQTNYGIWLTINSFVSWFSFFDIGLGNGLRNKYTESKVNNNMKLVKGYISTAYFSIGLFCLIILGIFFLVNNVTDWTIVFNTNKNLYNELRIIMPIVFTGFCLQIILKLVVTIYTADLNHSIQGKVNFIIQFFTIIVFYILSEFKMNSLINFSLYYTIIPLIILFVLNIVAFSNNFKAYKPSFRFFKLIYFKDIFSIGLSFLIIQMSWIIVTTTDTFLIAKLFSPVDVVPYNIVLKLFSILNFSFAIIIAPFWSTFTEAYTLKDNNWIKRAMFHLHKVIFLFILLGFFLLLFADKIYDLWLGDRIQIPFYFNLMVCINTIITIMISPYNFFLNGIGKIRVQLIQSVIFAIINIPLSIFLSKSMKMGIPGILFSTILCTIPGLMLSRYQYKLIIKEKAVGIWLK